MPNDLLADLIADAQQIVLPKPRAVEPPAASEPVDVVVIPESASSLVDGYAEYGV